jgi:hypothetical protein
MPGEQSSVSSNRQTSKCEGSLTRRFEAKSNNKEIASQIRPT